MQFAFTLRRKDYYLSYRYLVKMVIVDSKIHSLAFRFTLNMGKKEMLA